jgi:hypothetical protein
MVSLISRSEYIRQFESDEYSAILINFLLSKEISIDISIVPSNANDVSIRALSAIQKDDQKLFSNVFEYINKRKPKSDSDWINNDILLFALSLGVCKFKLDKKWLLEVLEIRTAHSHDENKLVAQTFIDVLQSNFDNANNYQPLMLVLKYFLDVSLGDESYINTIYQELTHNNYPYFKTSFLNLIALKAFDIILESKGMIDLEKQKATIEFVNSFSKRVCQIATIFWLLLFAIVISINIWFLYFYLTIIGPKQAEIINRILTFLPFLGIGGGLIVPTLTYRKKIIHFFEKPFHWFYGYKSDKH